MKKSAHLSWASSSMTSAFRESMRESGDHLARPLKQCTASKPARGAAGVTRIVTIFGSRIMLTFGISGGSRPPQGLELALSEMAGDRPLDALVGRHWNNTQS